MPDRSHRRSRRRRRRRRRIVRRVVLGGLLLGIGFSAWCSLGLISARADLTEARAHLVAASGSLSGDHQQVEREVERAAAASSAARAALRRQPLQLVARVPWVGDPIDSATSLADILGEVTHSALPPAVNAISTLTATPLPDNGRVDLGSIQRTRTPLATAESAIDDAVRRAQRVPARTWLPPVNHARGSFIDQLTKFSSELRAARTAADLVPGMLGADRPRTYLVALQNNAEARGTGGLVGGLLLFKADRGKLTLTRVVKDLALPPAKPVDLGQDYQDLYGATDPTEIWQNSNQSPHFPYAARIWRSLSRQLTGVTPDIVIGIDPVGLQRILEVTGPVPLPGAGSATSDNIVALTESEAYAQFSGARSARKTYLSDIAGATFQRIVGGQFQVIALGQSFERAAADSRIAIWSSAASEQARLSSSGLTHELPYDSGPFAGVVINNSYASKLDYYLSRTTRYRYGSCTADRQQVFVDVTLTNNVPDSALSPEVLGTYLRDGGSLPLRSNRLTVSLYSTWGSRLSALTVDGRAVGYGQGYELKHPVHYAVITLAPGRPVTVEFELSEPRSTSTPTIPVQPLTNPMRVEVSGSPCSG